MKPSVCRRDVALHRARLSLGFRSPLCTPGLFAGALLWRTKQTLFGACHSHGIRGDVLEGEWCSPVHCFSLAVSAREEHRFFMCSEGSYRVFQILPPHPPPGKTACSLAKAHMAFLCFKCSSYYLDLKVYRVKETFMEQLRPVRT